MFSLRVCLSLANTIFPFSSQLTKSRLCIFPPPVSCEPFRFILKLRPMSFPISSSSSQDIPTGMPALRVPTKFRACSLLLQCCSNDLARDGCSHLRFGVLLSQLERNFVFAFPCNRIVDPCAFLTSRLFLGFPLC